VEAQELVGDHLAVPVELAVPGSPLRTRPTLHCGRDGL
jgi:hypothetical protein